MIKVNTPKKFNYVNFECHCPDCDSLLEDFHTEEGYCDFFTCIEPWSVNEFYCRCDSCCGNLIFKRKNFVLVSKNWLDDYEASVI